MIQGQKVTLREKRLEDAPNDYRWRVDPELSKLDASVPIRISLGDFLHFYREELAYPTPRRQRFAIETLEGKHIGNCMLYDIDQTEGVAELGIMIGNKGYWSQGYGADAVHALVVYSFEQMNLGRVYLHTLEWNIRAQKAFTKVGFLRRAQVYRDGHDFIYMEVDRRRWEQLKRKSAETHPPED